MFVDLYVYGRTFETTLGNNTHKFSYFADILMKIGAHRLVFTRDSKCNSTNIDKVSPIITILQLNEHGIPF